ncbi:MAG: glycosyltransferase [Desulfobulbus sp.]|jgi:cellulose synthase/poly-beta-1,6-N-acetylglucosamine synthase-like glycosyltransferase/peptidoglycan/xylan/chitin deacetylase (PgdA/CDA1 family)/spore germination protein YaaH|uniref:polysaccharide deacetylase family protein n=1 Tax=Desulfobulbus sp. TaxID=895 RepID=UPI00284FD333|nr:polysaccharide deacetylase family protein [Desulfobulbus sp.]MDR2549314.1 glycosyltransferase [Desulfobulbus sp.]
MSHAPLDRESDHPPAPGNAVDKESFVFLDRRGKRWPRFRRLMFAAGLLVFVAIVLFIQTLVLPSPFAVPPAVEQLLRASKAQQSKKTMQDSEQPAKRLWLHYAKKHKEGKTEQAAAGTRRHPATAGHDKTAEAAVPPIRSGEIRLGFYESWNPDSLDSLKENLEKLTHVCPDWLSFDAEVGKLKSTADPQLVESIREQGAILMPLLSNLGPGDAWMVEAVESLINGPLDRQDRFIAHLVDTLATMQAGGVVLDWQQIDPSYKGNMSAFLARIAAALHRAHLELWLCVSTGQDLKMYDLDRIAGSIDHFVAMLHDEHAESDKPGPIASREFFNGWLSTLAGGYGSPGQWVISLGTYGYDWAEGNKSAELLSFADVMSRAKRSAQTTCTFSRPSLNPHFVYETGQTVHTIWFLDAITFLNQLTAARSFHVGGIAINKLGTEDPAIWDVLGLAFDTLPSRDQLARLETIKPGDDIAQIGRGNLISIEDERSDGTRSILVDKKGGVGAMLTATYQTFPGYLTIIHQGQGPSDGVTLTFDDGPDKKWTPQILDILKAKQVKATFFMIGANMEKHPKLVQRILNEGHMIGVHTYSHPNIAQVSEERAHLEFNATQRLLESITGHSTTLFRPPYNADTNPHEQEELVPIKLAQQMGYLTVTEDIDPEDWDKPGVEVMFDRIQHGRMRGGNVVLLHDAGGDRSQTVATLPLIIDYLNARGDRILSLPELLDIPAVQLMPAVQDNQQPVTRMISDSGFTALHELTNFFWAFMILATGLTVLRTLVVSWLAIRSRWHDERNKDDGQSFCPPVSVLIAAYNEEKVIHDTLRSVLNTDYPGTMEVVVVDDGSQDTTAAIVAAMAEDDPRICLIRQVNLGKAMALRNGMEAISHAFVVSLDADTQFTPQTIGHLIRPFADQKVGAVSGRAKVGNPKTLVARFQSLEYTCGFNLDRRAYHRLNCITVVPGAVSALRLSAIQAVGGISTETLAEDTDLTLALHKQGYTVHYASRAVAWTEAPETVRAFAKQRFRWAFGTLQCLWKHRELLFNPQYPALGWFSLPSAWFFNIILVALGSVIDLALLLSLALSPANSALYLYFLVFLAADLLLATVACLVEREPLAQTWLILPMRFIYRPVLNIVVIRAILRALRGVWVGWGKLDRTASVPYQA